jgi:hypothetical protein
MAIIQCYECQKDISDKASNCPNCGAPSKKQYSKSQKKEKQKLRCPTCNSTELTAQKKGFSGGKALGGAILTGGIGLLAGTIGSKKINITCMHCGYKFKPGNDKAAVEKKSKEQQRKQRKEKEKLDVIIKEKKNQEKKEKLIREPLNNKASSSPYKDVNIIREKLNSFQTIYSSTWHGPLIDIEAKPWDLGIDIFGSCKAGDGSVGGTNQKLMELESEEFLFLIRDNTGFSRIWFTSHHIYCWTNTDPGLKFRKLPYKHIYDLKQPFLSKKLKSVTLDISFDIGVNLEIYINEVTDYLMNFINGRDSNQDTHNDKNTISKKEKNKETTDDAVSIQDVFNLNRMKKNIILDPDHAMKKVTTGFSKWRVEYEIEGEILFGICSNVSMSEIVTTEGIYRRKMGKNPDFSSFKNIEQFIYKKKSGFFDTSKLIDESTKMSIDLGILTLEGKTGLDKGGVIIPILVKYLNQLAERN